MLQEDTLHDVIIAVRISPQVGQLRIAPVEADCSHALCVFATARRWMVGIRASCPLLQTAAVAYDASSAAIELHEDRRVGQDGFPHL